MFVTTASRQTLLLALCLLPLTLAAQVVLTNPGIPARETMVYSEKTGDRRGTTKQTLTLREQDGKSWYEVQSLTAESETISRLDSRTLAGFYSEVLEKSKDSTIRRTTEVLASSIVLRKDEVMLSDLNSFITALRGFPFARTNFAKVVFAGSQASLGGFSMELNVIGKETVKIGTTSHECWKLQLGMSGFLGGMVPKSQYWYAVKAPNYLVRFEGARGGPTSPITILELQSYESAD